MSRETFISMEDGNLVLITENDGWSMNRGPERQERPVTLEELKGGPYYEQAKRLLASASKGKAAR